MQISTLIQWQVVKWPNATTNAAQYAIFQDAATMPVTVVSGGATSTLVSYDEAASGTVFTIRPTDGAAPTPLYGPPQTVVFANQPLNHRAWVRSRVRKSMADRTDQAAGTIPTVSDDELNDYLNDAIRNYSQHFPLEKSLAIPLEDMLRDYPLPGDWQRAATVRYDFNDGTNTQQYLKEEPFKGGESGPTSWTGMTKLGIVTMPFSGRYYAGHYDVWDNKLHLDFDPTGNSGVLTIRYKGDHLYPTSDLQVLDVPNQDIELLLLYIEAIAWREIEGKDVRLSRWERGQSGNAKRDDLPTEKMSTRLFNAWNQAIRTRLSLRPKSYRLVRTS